MYRNAYLWLMVIIMLCMPGNIVEQVIAEESTDEVIFAIPVSKSGEFYETPNVDEACVFGPSALAVGPDGTFWIADATGKRLCQYGSDGLLLKSIDTSKFIVRLSDICVTDKGIFVLDMAAEQPMVWHLDLDGTPLTQYPSPVTLADGLSGIVYTIEGGLILEIEGGARLVQLLDASGARTQITLAEYPYSTGRYRVSPPDVTNRRFEGGIQVGERTIPIQTRSPLVGLRLLRAEDTGNFYVIVEEMLNGPTIYVDQTVHAYNAQGQRVGVVRIPLAEQFTYVEHALAVSADHNVYLLRTRPQQIEVQRLHFSTQLPSSLPSAPALIEQKPDTTLRAYISRSTIIANAATYLNNSVSLSSTNINASCTGRTKPRYLGAAGTYKSVSYDWGGWDTVADFNRYMGMNYTAGDINSEASESCSRGVDCSGFVTRSWGRTDKKYGTSTLSQISNALDSFDSLIRGDIINKAGSHVRLFAGFSSGGAYYYESTTGGYDRVIYRYLAWSSNSGYVPRRYVNVINDEPIPPGDWPVHSTTTNNSGANVYAIQYLLKQRGQTLAIDGSFGTETQNRVQNVQSACGLSVNGIVDASTWQKALIMNVSKGSNGDAVRAVQYLLKYRFGYDISVDGDFGSATQAAAINFQESKELMVDGIIGPQTWLALVSNP